MTALWLDLTTDPLPERKFDLVMSLLTLHHIPDTKALLGSFFRLLRAPGTVCLANLDREDGSFHGKDANVIHGFDRVELAAALHGAGFGNIAFTTAASITKPTQEGELRTYPVFLAVGRKVA